MRQKLIDSLRLRTKKEIAPQNPIKYLKNFEVEDYIDIVISVVYLYTRPKKKGGGQIYLTEVISAIGHKVRSKLKQKTDSSNAAKTGAFILYSFEELGILFIKLGYGGKHQAYIVEILKDNVICELWQSITSKEIEKIPSLYPYLPWTSTRHHTGMSMVKTQNKYVLKTIKPETHGMLFDCLNSAQRTGWMINDEIFKLHLWALRNKTDAFADIWEQHNPEAKATKLREAKAIGDIAKKFIGKVFYHLYYFDFRGRKYAATAYLHEQGSDLARGMLLRHDKKAIGVQGFFWLMVSIASNWAGPAGRLDNLKTDKIPLKERYQWALDNEELLLSFAEAPKIHQDWMKADKPWQFLAGCFELKKFREFQKELTKNLPEGLKGSEEMMHSYESHLECFIDGTNNGSQHLCALTKDEVVAPHVNLVPLDFPGDLYRYVATHVWKSLEKQVSLLTDEEIEECENFIDRLIKIKKKLNAAPANSATRAKLIDSIQEFKGDNFNLMVIAAPVFWNRIQDAQQRRKVVKRNTMTLPYGGTAYGLGQQIIDDAKKHGIDQLYYMEHKWGAFLGREIFETCKHSLQRLMHLLERFEAAGKAAETRNEFLSWTVPITNFPVVQHYTQGKVKKTWVQYGPAKGHRNSTGYYQNTLQLMVCNIEDTVPSKGKQSQGAAPNAIHSLDAAHLVLITHKAKFSVTTVHDSFGCLLADMPELFKITREAFVELHEAKPLESIMRDIGGDLSDIEIGELDIRLLIESEYCFS